jgi:hypothetical protein
MRSRASTCELRVNRREPIPGWPSPVAIPGQARLEPRRSILRVAERVKPGGFQKRLLSNEDVPAFWTIQQADPVSGRRTVFAGRTLVMCIELANLSVNTRLTMGAINQHREYV